MLSLGKHGPEDVGLCYISVLVCIGRKSRREEDREGEGKRKERKKGRRGKEAIVGFCFLAS